MVVTLATTRKSLVLLLKSMDQIAETAFQIQKVLAHTVVGSVDEPKARESFRMGRGAKKDALGNISPNNIGPIFSTFIVELADLDTILKDVAAEDKKGGNKLSPLHMFKKQYVKRTSLLILGWICTTVGYFR